MNADASAMVLRVRGVEPGDAEAVSMLLEALGYPCTVVEAHARIAHFREEDRQFLFLAERDGEPAGLAAMKLNYSLTRGACCARWKRWRAAMARCVWKSRAIPRAPARMPSITRAVTAMAPATS